MLNSLFTGCGSLLLTGFPARCWVKSYSAGADLSPQTSRAPSFNCPLTESNNYRSSRSVALCCHLTVLRSPVKLEKKHLTPPLSWIAFPQITTTTKKRKTLHICCSRCSNITLNTLTKSLSYKAAAPHPHVGIICTSARQGDLLNRQLYCGGYTNSSCCMWMKHCNWAHLISSPAVFLAATCAKPNKSRYMKPTIGNV